MMRLGKKHQQQLLFSHSPSTKGARSFPLASTSTWWRRFIFSLVRRQYLLILLALMALSPPFYFHFRLRRFHQMQAKRCRWLISPPLVCAHGGDSLNSFPNTMTAYYGALRSRADCIEIDVSRSSDGVLFALHDRDLQKMTGNHTSRVGYLSMKEIKELGATYQYKSEFHDQKVPTVEDALMSMSNSVRQVILDAKVGPPTYEKGRLAADIVSVVKRTECANCIVWAKSDTLVRDIIRLAPSITVGYVVMKDASTGVGSNLLRVKNAEIVGVYHPLVDEKLVRILHRRSKKVYAWTVDDMASMQNMLSEHVDAIVTSNLFCSNSCKRHELNA